MTARNPDVRDNPLIFSRLQSAFKIHTTIDGFAFHQAFDEPVYQGSHWGEIYGDIPSSFCQISHTFDQREILLSHKILKYFPQKINWQMFQLKMTIWDFGLGYGVL